jgi:hypothetical protein
MIAAGKYKGKATSLDWAEKTFQGDTKVMIVVNFDAWEPDSDSAEPFELTWTGHFTEKSQAITLAQLKQLGFNGAPKDVTSVTLAQLQNEVELKVSYKEWQGEQQMRVQIVTPFVGEKAKKTTLDKLAAQLGGSKTAAAPKWADDEGTPFG